MSIFYILNFDDRIYYLIQGSSLPCARVITGHLNRPNGVKILISIQFLLSAISIPSGVLLLLKPGGEAIGAQVILPYLTERISFVHDFTIVGAFLLIVYGFLPTISAFGMWIQKKWSWILTLLLGLTEIAWISTEVILFYDLGFIFFYPLIAGMGAVTVALCLLSSVRVFFFGKYATDTTSSKPIIRQETMQQ